MTTRTLLLVALLSATQAVAATEAVAVATTKSLDESISLDPLETSTLRMGSDVLANRKALDATSSSWSCRRRTSPLSPRWSSSASRPTCS